MLILYEYVNTTCMYVYKDDECEDVVGVEFDCYGTGKRHPVYMEHRHWHQVSDIICSFIVFFSV